jgi:hypothetical protein
VRSQTFLHSTPNRTEAFFADGDAIPSLPLIYYNNIVSKIEILETMLFYAKNSMITINIRADTKYYRVDYK